MSTDKILRIYSESVEDTLQVGEKIGQQLKGNETIELVGDIGCGKTVFVRGLAKGAGSSDSVASPSFTISRVYNAEKFNIYHFDFYRLSDPGIIKSDIEETVTDDEAVVVVEWADVVEDVLPQDRVKINITATDETKREITIDLGQALESEA